MIDARNVTDNPHNNFYACSEFLNKVTKAYLICGALHHFGMEKTDGVPQQHVYTGDPNDKQAKQAYVKDVLKCFIEEHVVTNLPELNQQAPISNDLKCRFCNRRYVRTSALRNHEEREHGFEAVRSNPTSQTNPSSDEDRLYNYTRQALLLWLLRMDHEDAIKLADGENPKYAVAMLHLQAQVNCLLSPRLAHSLTWNRFVNHQGQIDTNFPMDKEIEHDNLAFKTDIHSFKGEITDRSIARVSHSTGPTNEILSTYDNSTHIRKPSGKHSEMSTEEDVITLVDQFMEVDLYNSIAGRKHSAFPDMKQNLLADFNVEDLKSWISKSLKTFSRKHFYQL